MELFCLGPNGPDGTRTTPDRRRRARAAFTGWSLQQRPSSTYGRTFTPDRFDIARRRSRRRRRRASPARRTAADCVNQAVDIVLAHPNHAQFLIRKLWAEFIASPIPQATLDASSRVPQLGYQLKPVIRGILTTR
jgi:uncharacterized protein (DUF1800 family)